MPMSGRCPVYLCTRLYVANIGHARQTSLMSLLPEHAKAESGRNDSKFSFTFREHRLCRYDLCNGRVQKEPTSIYCYAQTTRIAPY
jgi:hypothetical protein